MNPRQAVIFDLDGTLLDTLTDLATSGNEVLRNRGLPTHPVDAYRTFIGDGMNNLVRRIFPADLRPGEGAETAAALAEYREAYGRHWQDTTTLFPGIAELLDRLGGRGVPIGVLSNKAHDFTVKCVDHFLGNWKWDVVLGARDRVPRKPDPSGALEASRRMGTHPADCFFLGDSDVDMLTASNAAMQPVGVSWGFRSVEELKSAGAIQVIDRADELLPLMEGAIDDR